MPDHGTILIIDHDREIADGAAIRLRASGLNVLLAPDGRQGFRLAVEQRPGVILLDVHVPPADGMTTLARIRQHEETRNTPVVVFSADTLQSRQALLMGAQYRVTKPYDWQTLLTTVRLALEKGRITERQGGTCPRMARPSGRLRADVAQGAGTTTNLAAATHHRSRPSPHHDRSRARTESS